MDLEGKILMPLFIVSCLFCGSVLAFNLHQKDIYRKELILNCNGNLDCIQLILGRDNKYGY